MVEPLPESFTTRLFAGSEFRRTVSDDGYVSITRWSVASIWNGEPELVTRRVAPLRERHVEGTQVAY